MKIIDFLDMLVKFGKDYRTKIGTAGVVRNKHMNDYRGEEPPQELVDAIVVDFINYIGVRNCVDYALYAKDLSETETENVQPQGE